MHSPRNGLKNRAAAVNYVRLKSNIKNHFLIAQD